MYRKTDKYITYFFKILSAVAESNNYNELTLIEKEWILLINLAKCQNIFPLVFEKASEYSGFLSLPEYSRLTMETTIMVTKQTRKTEEFLSLYEKLSNVRIYPIVMKGIICRQLYGEYCDHRPSGDEDILIQKSEYECVKNILIENGYFPDKQDIGDSQLNELQEITFSNPNSDLMIEVHLNPIGKGNELQTKMNSYFENAFDKSIQIQIEDVLVRTMCSTDHFLYLILHAFRHFLSSGFGIRQVLDILLFEKKYINEIDFDYLVESLNEVHANKFFADIVSIGNQYLGFNLPQIIPQNCPDELLDDLLNGGIFGNETHEQRTALELTKAAVANSYNSKQLDKKMKKFGSVWKLVFPSKRQIINSYPELDKNPWKLPLCWVKRWLKFFKYKKLSNDNLALESLKISKRRIDLLKKYDIL